MEEVDLKTSFNLMTGLSGLVMSQSSMEQRQRRRSQYQDKYNIVLLGRKARLKDVLIKRIIEDDELTSLPNDCLLGEGSRFRVISPPDIFDENDLYPDQHIIDCMALSHPGPCIFILAIDLDNAQEPKIVEQIQKLQTIFGDNICQNLVVTLPDIESFQLLGHLKERFNISLATANENLASECKEWCVGRKPFTYNCNNYSDAVVKRRREVLFWQRNTDHSPREVKAVDPEPIPQPLVLQNPDIPRREPPPEPEPVHVNPPLKVLAPQFVNIILLGLTGTGKSASANTILAATKSKRKFPSMSNSEPVTMRCESETTELYGTRLTVVDTPDFFHENVKNSQQQLAECKKYFVPDHYMVLLVLRLNRFTDEERDILEKVENKLQMSIRQNTTLLLTCGEDLKGRLSEFINLNKDLQKVARQCQYRCHAFKNRKSNTNQVKKLFKKFPEYQTKFPKIDEKRWLRFAEVSVASPLKV